MEKIEFTLDKMGTEKKDYESRIARCEALSEQAEETQREMRSRITELE